MKIPHDIPLNALPLSLWRKASKKEQREYIEARLSRGEISFVCHCCGYPVHYRKSCKDYNDDGTFKYE